MTGLEYSLVLETGEEIDILELDPEVYVELQSAEVKAAASSILKRCSYVSRDVLEEAKNGFCKRLQESLRTPPLGCLLTITEPECVLMEECGIADRAICTTRYVFKSEGKFPVCWEARLSEPCSEDVGRKARDLTSRVVHAWRENRYVIIVTS
jgi:hypothetical protein